jgi:hypothetical protein
MGEINFDTKPWRFLNSVPYMVFIAFNGNPIWLQNSLDGYQEVAANF